jgi:hypothetical protein
VSQAPDTDTEKVDGKTSQMVAQLEIHVFVIKNEKTFSKNFFGSQVFFRGFGNLEI